ncbi:MAG: hypothetical protein A2163_08210 [Actinobacteria bacterium RBG_13_35_12]|nr:MAG: hypothetical protein A2163_08210 [Actinobacteria bacterium RBG_13_35_12]
MKKWIGNILLLCFSILLIIFIIEIALRFTHWNIKGNHLVGLIVAKDILEKKLLDVPDREQKLNTIEKSLSEFK